MAVFTTNITTNTTTKLCDITKPREYNKWLATIGATGTFGGTTITWNWSTDNGTTLFPVTVTPGTAYTTTAADAFDVEFGVSRNNTYPLSLFAVTTGGTGASITITVADNRG